MKRENRETLDSEFSELLNKCLIPSLSHAIQCASRHESPFKVLSEKSISNGYDVTMVTVTMTSQVHPAPSYQVTRLPVAKVLMAQYITLCHIMSHVP